MAFALSQFKQNATGASGTTRAVTVTAIGSANLLVVIGCWNTSTSAASTTPTATGLTFTQIGADVVNGTNRSAMWYAKNTTSGATSVTFNVGNTTTFLDAYCLEFTGADTTAPLRTNQSGTGSSTTATTAAMTVTVGDLIVAGSLTTATSATNLSVKDTDASSDGNGIGHTLSAGSTSITPSFTTTSGPWAMIGAAFIPAAAAGGTVSLLSMMGLGT